MSKKAYSQGSVVHVIKRGARGMPIVQDNADRYRFLKSLYFLNDTNHPTPWERDVDAISPELHFNRPQGWSGDREPYVDILSYCLLDNHFHLILREREVDGVSLFLKSLCSSMTLHFNERYDGRGSIFQGRPNIRVVNTDRYLKLLFIYVNIKNPFEIQSGGLAAAIRDFTSSWKQACSYPFCSLGTLMRDTKSPIIISDIFEDHFENKDSFQSFAHEQLRQYQLFLEELEFEE